MYFGLDLVGIINKSECIMVNIGSFGYKKVIRCVINIDGKEFVVI